MKTPEEIKYALRWCWAEDAKNQCFGCPYRKYDDCQRILQAAALDYIRQLEDHIRDLAKMVPRWISVKDRLPENSLRALVRVIHSYNHTDGYAEIAMSYFVNGRWEDIPPKYYDVTHWMPLPELPEVKNANE